MKHLLIIAAAMAAAVSFADEPSKEKPEGRRQFRREGAMRRFQNAGNGGFAQREINGAWLLKSLTNKENLRELNVDEEKIEALTGKCEELLKKSAAIESQIRQLSRKQAADMRKFVNGELENADELLKQVDDIALLRADQGRLSIESILFLRSNLSKEQLSSVMKMLNKRGMERRRFRGVERPGEDGRHPRGNRDRGARTFESQSSRKSAEG